MAWVTETDLELALGSSTYLALFDDGSGTANALAVQQVIKAAHADVLRFAVRGWDGEVPTPPPDELFFLELDFARARAFMRGDMYTRDTGKEIFAAARETGKEVAASLQRGGAEMPNPTPALAELPPTPERATIGPFQPDSGLACTSNLMFWRTEGQCCRGR